MSAPGEGNVEQQQAADPCGTGLPCDEAVARLWEYVDSELEVLDRQRVEEHLAECTPCLHEEQLEVVMKALVRRCCEKEQAPAELRLRIHEQITVMRLQVVPTDEV